METPIEDNKRKACEDDQKNDNLDETKKSKKDIKIEPTDEFAQIETTLDSGAQIKPTNNSIKIDPNSAMDGKTGKKYETCYQCNDQIAKARMKEHMVKCKLYQNFILNGTQCNICSKKYATRSILFSHIGNYHREEIEKAKNEGQYLI